jgi:hypothetical protein
MQIFEVATHSIKPVMNQLLKDSAFDDFLVRSAEVCVIAKVEISGILDKSYLPEDERDSTNRNYVYWKEVQPFVFSLIKGGRTPGMLKIVFSATDEKVKEMHDNASAMFLNLVYEQGKLRFTTAVGQRFFSMDKSSEAIWSEYIKDFFNKNNWSVSILN